MGSSEGERIPIDGGYLKDESGSDVVTRVNTELCKSIAEAGKGVMFEGASVVSLSRRISDELGKLPQAVVTAHAGTTEELYGWFVAAALICMLLMELILMRKSRFVNRLRIFDR